MSTLPNYPMVAQRTDYTADGLPSENKEMNCVPSSILSMIMYLLGIQQVDKEWDPDRILNMAYPEGYKGGTEASKFVDACKHFGVHLFPVDGDNATLVTRAHQYLAQGKPVLFTIVDPYMPANSGYTHVCTWFADGPGTLTAMDPWPARPVTHSDAEWIAAMRFNEIWIAELLQPIQQGDLPMLQLTDPMGHFFTQVDASHWHCTPTGVDLAYGHLTFYRQHQGIFGLVRTNEIYLKQYPDTAIVVFERSVNAYDPGRIFPNEAPPGAGSVYLMLLQGGGSGIGLQLVAKPLLAELQAQVSQLQAQIAAQTDNAQLQAQLASYQAAVKQVDALMHPLATA